MLDKSSHTVFRSWIKIFGDINGQSLNISTVLFSMPLICDWKDFLFQFMNADSVVERILKLYGSITYGIYILTNCNDLFLLETHYKRKRP